MLVHLELSLDLVHIDDRVLELLNVLHHSRLVHIHLRGWDDLVLLRKKLVESENERPTLYLTIMAELDGAAELKLYQAWDYMSVS